MPVLYLLAGPNGTGKTTFYTTAVEGGFISPELPFVNIDLITKSLGGYSYENYTNATEIYRNEVRTYLEKQQDFMIESNLADSRDYDWILNMKKNGYEAILYYLSTDDVEINIARVKRRVAEGGHDVAEPIIRSRYAQSHSYLKTRMRLFKEAYLIDNSSDLFQVHARLINGTITEKSSTAPAWINDVLSIIQRLDKRW